jgi:hypothetical protein
VTLILPARVKRQKQRIAVRRWEYRQRNTSKGVWLRLRLALAQSERLFAVSEEAMAALVADGFQPLAVGFELHPKKQLVVVPLARALHIDGARELPVRLSADVLGAVNLVLVPFVAEGEDEAERCRVFP